MMNCTCPQGSWDRTKQCKHILWNKFTFKRSNNMMWAMIFAVSQTSSANSQRLNKISKLKGSKGRVNMLNLSKSVPQGCWRFRSNRCQDWLANNNASGQFYMCEWGRYCQKVPAKRKWRGSWGLCQSITKRCAHTAETRILNQILSFLWK